MMSSPTKPFPCEGVVFRGGQPTGPVRLPLADRQRFIETFNRTYQSQGMSITALRCPASDSEIGETPGLCSPGAGDVAADRDR
jgi:hypothetical protein